MKFVVKNIEICQSGQGVIGITCDKLWEMDNEEFKKLFLTEKAKMKQLLTMKGGMKVKW